ncbi:ABC transporter ATP-binding protein [Microlunatus speluncae]|uniref:ABC transporter ATP-binding protein n=1 Tax=Microlunatus speluncae TaxID=2594267 RepID=UPI0012663336|nr:betaine/proline/choline family ABC transporter ATP-binding protein [Microlunatus speluncae]
MTLTAPGGDQAAPEQSRRVMIRLEQLTKTYPGGKRPAVDGLTLDVNEGEIVILVGPSGCGKTTTMKMINRIIEPTSGKIIIDDTDVTRTDPDQLRRRIGYVIQQTGLFPHRTLAQNIATVPKLLGWDAARIRNRVDELLRLVNMDPDTYRDRYPKQLSGGQAQRIGVARALGGDPQVMLMDEPFGALDPITRDRLQNEFLRLQAEMHKTIVFVTHDIDEAIKMGDRIAILQEGSEIAQFDTPEQILTAPANEFVADFIGGGAALKGLHLRRVEDIELGTWPTVEPETNPVAAMDLVRRTDCACLLVLGPDRRPLRWINATDLRRGDGRPLDQIGQVPEAVVDRRTSLHEVLNQMVAANYATTVVVDDRGGYLGVIDIDQINETIRAMRREAGERDRQRMNTADTDGPGREDEPR